MSTRQTHWKTRLGDMAPVAPDFEREAAEWDALFEDAAEVLDVIDVAQKRKSRMAQNDADAMSTRFPRLGG